MAAIMVVAVEAPAGALRAPSALHNRTAHSSDPRLTELDTRTSEPAMAVPPRTTAARQALSARLGPGGVIQSDPRTGTLRVLARLDGFLTGRSDLSAQKVALDYVRHHLAAFGLDVTDLETLTLVRDYVDILGTHHLLWQQRFGGVPLFDDDLRAAVTKRGQLAMVGGSPVHELASAPSLAAGVPSIGAGAADAAVRASVSAPVALPGAMIGTGRGPLRASTFSSGDSAELVLFRTNAGTKLAWRVIAPVAADAKYLSVVDATSGAVLWRANLVHYDVSGSGLGWDYYPSDLVPAGGGTQHPVAFPVADDTRLKGNNAWVIRNVQADYRSTRLDQVPANGAGPSWTFPAALDTTTASENCNPHWACTWNSHVPFSWRTNIRQNAVQFYYYLNAYHDHLLAPPIGFTEAAGNFQQVNSTGQGLGGDPVVGWSDTGASIDHGLPDRFTFNAFIDVPPDGSSPQASMLMFDPKTGRQLGNPDVPAGNAGDDASVVYHEYTHGLSLRLITDSSGFGALYTNQAGAMGEAWSDWYALDFLAAQGFITDTPNPGDVTVGYYIQGGHASPVRTEPMDCPVGSTDPICPGGETGHTGGYTYADFGKIIGFPEYHADGEIWSQTLWDLRTALGSSKVETLDTRAMELSPPNPSFLDLRDAILVADRIAFGGADTQTIWQVFAARGMGFFASTNGSDDFQPVADFSPPPVCPAQCARVSGTVTDAETGAPIVHAIVTLGPYSARTDHAGAFQLRKVGLHTYPSLAVTQRGYEQSVVGPVDVAGDSTVDVGMHVDWASLERGGVIVSFKGPRFRPCGPAKLLDLDPQLGWFTTRPRHPAGTRAVVVGLPKAINVTSFGVNPGPACFAPDKFAVASFDIQTSVDGVHWTTAFVQTDPLPPGVMNTLLPTTGTAGVNFVRLLLRTPVGSRQRYITVSELSVRGTPA